MWSQHPEFGTQSTVDGLRIERPGSTAPVVRQGRPSVFPPHDEHTGMLFPTRPAGASWCGAQDMFGNVWEIVAENVMLGGSFRHHDGWNYPRPPESVPDDAAGFRVRHRAKERK